MRIMSSGGNTRFENENQRNFLYPNGERATTVTFETTALRVYENTRVLFWFWDMYMLVYLSHVCIYTCGVSCPHMPVCLHAKTCTHHIGDLSLEHFHFGVFAVDFVRSKSVLDSSLGDKFGLHVCAHTLIHMPCMHADACASAGYSQWSRCYVIFWHLSK